MSDEHDFEGGITIVKDYIFAAKQRQREMFVPLSHPPGHAQADFGEALAVIGGVEQKIHFLVMDLPHSDACFLKAYPAETAEAFCDGRCCTNTGSSGNRGRVASITGQARSTLTRENGQPTDSNLAQPSSVILLRARTPICASVF